ncbi:hypothetical protein YC2023_104458 [Brassica napus]
MGHPSPLSRPVGPIPSDGRSKSLFTDPAITTRPFSVLWPHSHGIVNHFPIGHSSFHYSSSNTLNSGVLNGCVTEKDCRAIEGSEVVIAHSGRTDVLISRFGENLKGGISVTGLEERWTIDDMAFDVPGLSIDCFISPKEMKMDFYHQDGPKTFPELLDERQKL